MKGIEIVGAKGKVSDPEELYLTLQRMGHGSAAVMNPDKVCGKEHLMSAATHAQRAFERGNNSSSSLGLETVLYASGERQISRALEKMGLIPGSEEVALVLFDLDPDDAIEGLGMARDDGVLECTLEKLRAFGITDEELNAVPRELMCDLVLERVAFVEIIKR